jgi:hypothetical protein
VEDCFASVTIISRRVEEIKAELSESRGLTVDHVIVTSDERDEAWWGQIMDQGWYRVDHSGTAERYGAWYVTFLVVLPRSELRSIL